jgi:hypothetical protein
MITAMKALQRREATVVYILFITNDLPRRRRLEEQVAVRFFKERPITIFSSGLCFSEM